jgi:hypothetical protein
MVSEIFSGVSAREGEGIDKVESKTSFIAVVVIVYFF